MVFDEHDVLPARARSGAAMAALNPVWQWTWTAPSGTSSRRSSNSCSGMLVAPFKCLTVNLRRGRKSTTYSPRLTVSAPPSTQPTVYSVIVTRC